jgi:hypothetical protein
MERDKQQKVETNGAITRELLESRGYKYFGIDTIHSAELFQKRVVDLNGVTKYFINCYSYSTSTFEFELNLEKNTLNYNITIFGNTTIDDVENEIERLWIENKFNYYGVK